MKLTQQKLKLAIHEETLESSNNDMNISSNSDRVQQGIAWKEIHSKIIDFRSRKKLSISNFLRRCGLDPYSSYFKQLCCKSGQDRNPSNIEGSPDRSFKSREL